MDQSGESVVDRVRPNGRREAAADEVVHVLGVSAGVAGFGFLLALGVRQGDVPLAVSVIVYGIGLVAMLTCSAIYNMSRDPVRRARLRRIDHALIFVMIAATYTPFLVVKIGGGLGYGMLAFVWTVAAGGAALKLLLPGRFERLSLALYLLLGWSILLALEPLFESVSRSAVILIGIGGLLYTVGVLAYLAKRLPYHLAIWHMFVLAAAACHYAAVLSDVALAGRVA